jgi:hypothetical protein
MRRITACVLLLVASSLSLAQEGSPPAAPAYDWSQVARAFGTSGEVKGDVYTITVPRSDLNVMIEGMDVPAAAGIASVFHFFQCPCGKIRVVGQVCCAEWETNDVIDALRAGNAIRIASVAPMFAGEKPRLSVVRFQGEGDGFALAKVLKSALDWTGPARTATRPSP